MNTRKLVVPENREWDLQELLQHILMLHMEEIVILHTWPHQPIHPLLHQSQQTELELPDIRGIRAINNIYIWSKVKKIARDRWHSTLTRLQACPHFYISPKKTHTQRHKLKGTTKNKTLHNNNEPELSTGCQTLSYFFWLGDWCENFSKKKMNQK